ncbi:EAL domain-containing protein [Tepidibacter mesophilus]|uniref:EAL domain-containing protein n=1 Tax=Tepidibacter mesophilus TaxID=655607 RepID=UPI000C0758FE|nr:EAL domain-containing protein [Tepidibacter mesophilus]
MESKKLRYFFLICTVIFTLTCSIIYYSYNNYKKEILLNVEENLVKSSQNYSVFILNAINPVATLIENTGDVLASSDLKDSNEIKMIFNKMTDNVPIISNVYFVNDENGDKFSCNGKVNNLIDLRNRFWYKKANSSDKPIITEVYNDLNNHKPVITIAYSIKKDNKLKGVFSADIFLEDIYETFKITTYTENIVHYIMDDSANIILHTSKEILGLSMINPQKSYMNKFSNKEKINLKKYIKIWKENKTDILKYSSGNLYYDQTKEKIFGYFYKVPNLNWIIVSRIDSQKIEMDTNLYLSKTALWGLIVFIFLIIFIYSIFTNIYNKDDLTNIYNKNKLLEVLQKQSYDEQIILFMDIYNFSSINGIHGSTFGNTVIKKLTNILNNNLSSNGLLIHSKADDFLFLFNSQDWEDALYKSKKLNELLNNLEIKIDDLNVNINLFLGLTKINASQIKDWKTSILLIEDIFNNLKKKTESGLLVFPDFNELLKIRRKQDIKKEEIIKAMEENRIVPFFQPIYNLKENKIEKYEVLMRIKNGENYLSPFPYIKVAEENNLISNLDLMVIKKAMEYKNDMDKEDKIKLSINASGKDLNDSEFLPKVVHLADQYKIKYENIIFEITETQNIDNIDSLVKTIYSFKELGFTFSIDDFGTGFSSMQYLKRIPADYLKIDGSFIKDINEKEENLYIVKSIANMAKAFKMQTIAEFVENEEILNTIKELKIDYAQGYYIGKPHDKFLE